MLQGLCPLLNVETTVGQNHGDSSPRNPKPGAGRTRGVPRASVPTGGSGTCTPARAPPTAAADPVRQGLGP